MRRRSNVLLYTHFHLEVEINVFDERCYVVHIIDLRQKLNFSEKHFQTFESPKSQFALEGLMLLIFVAFLC